MSSTATTTTVPPEKDSFSKRETFRFPPTPSPFAPHDRYLPAPEDMRFTDKHHLHEYHVHPAMGYFFCLFFPTGSMAQHGTGYSLAGGIFATLLFVSTFPLATAGIYSPLSWAILGFVLILCILTALGIARTRPTSYHLGCSALLFLVVLVALIVASFVLGPVLIAKIT